MTLKKTILTLFVIALSQQSAVVSAADGRAFSAFTEEAKLRFAAFYDQAETYGAGKFESLEQWASTRPEDAAVIKGQISGEIQNACMDTATAVAPTAPEAYQPACVCVGDEAVTRLWTGPRADIDDDRLIVGDLLDAEQFCFEAFPVESGSGDARQ